MPQQKGTNKQTPLSETHATGSSSSSGTAGAGRGQTDCPWLLYPSSTRSAAGEHGGSTSSLLHLPPGKHSASSSHPTLTSHARCWRGPARLGELAPSRASSGAQPRRRRAQRHRVKLPKAAAPRAATQDCGRASFWVRGGTPNGITSKEAWGNKFLNFTSAVLLPCSLVTGTARSDSVLPRHWAVTARFPVPLLPLDRYGWIKPLSLRTSLGGKGLCSKDLQLSCQKLHKSIFDVSLSWTENVFFHFILFCGLYCVMTF